MKIENLNNLDVGVSSIEIEGNVNYISDIKNWVGKTSKGRAYDFWSQFIVVEDSTDSIGCSLTMKKETDAIEEGDYVKIRGKLEEYTNNEGEVQRKLKGKVIKNKDAESKEEKKETTGVEKVNNGNNNGKGDKNLYIARECAIKASVELISAKKIKYEELFLCAEEIVQYIYEGYQKPEKEELVKEEPVKKMVEPKKDTKDEIADEDIPF